MFKMDGVEDFKRSGVNNCKTKTAKEMALRRSRLEPGGCRTNMHKLKHVMVSET